MNKVYKAKIQVNVQYTCPHCGNICSDKMNLIDNIKQQPWNVIYKGKKLTTVYFDKGYNQSDIINSLINHDGYPSGISLQYVKPSEELRLADLQIDYEPCDLCGSHTKVSIDHWCSNCKKLVELIIKDTGYGMKGL